MLAKGDLKFRLKGKRLNGDFALVHIKGRRPGSKGTEWLLIKKKDDQVVAGFDASQYDTSVLTNRTMAQIAGDEGSAEWTSSRPRDPRKAESSVAGGSGGAGRQKEEIFNHRGRKGNQAKVFHHRGHRGHRGRQEKGLRSIRAQCWAQGRFDRCTEIHKQEFLCVLCGLCG